MDGDWDEVRLLEGGHLLFPAVPNRASHALTPLMEPKSLTLDSG